MIIDINLYATIMEVDLYGTDLSVRVSSEDIEQILCCDDQRSSLALVFLPCHLPQLRVLVKALEHHEPEKIGDVE